MLISHSKKFIYIKTIKTAGSSVELALQHHCLPAGTEIKGPTDYVDTDAGIVGARGGASIQGQLWHNHMPARKIRNQVPQDVWDGYCKICNIRNPWDKTVSFFHMMFPDIKTEDPDTITTRFRSWIAEADELGTDTHIYFIDDLPVADEYIRYDTLTADLERITTRLDLEIGVLPQAKSNMRGRNKIPYQTYYDTAGRQRVAETYALEIEHFNWTFD